MSYLYSDTTQIKLADSPLGDAFGRVRVSEPQTTFDSQLQYDKQPLLWDEKIVGTASSTHLPNESSVRMEVGSTTGDRIIRQTREYFRYQPGKSHLIMMTYAFDQPSAGTRKLVGYGDDQNGIFIGQDDGGIFVLLRSFSTGSVDDSRKVYQQDWNIDRLDGTGASRYTLNPASTQIFFTDIEWLGVGRVRVGLVIDGKICYVHEYNNANERTSVYMTTANLPCRYELTNLAGEAAASMKQICAQVSSEGGLSTTLAYPFSQPLMNVPIPSGEENAVLVFATRHAATFNGVTNRTAFIPNGFEILSSGAQVVAQIVYNPTIVTTGWAPANPSSIMEATTFAQVTSWTGGQRVNTTIMPAVEAEGPRASVSPVFGKTITSRLPFGLGIDGDDPIALAMIAYSVGETAIASFSFSWEELR